MTLIQMLRGIGRSILAALLLGLGALACASLPHDFEPLGVQVIDVAPLPGGRLEQRMQVTLRLQNPNDFPVEIEGMRFDIEINDRPLARAVSPEGLEVPRLGETTTQVEASTTWLDWVRQLGALGGRNGLDYALRGALFVSEPDRFEMPIQSEGQTVLEGRR